VGIVMGSPAEFKNNYKGNYQGSYSSGKTNGELKIDIERLIFALGLMTGTVAKHQLDIEDEDYEELMNELLEISADVMGKL
jgi:hypothetical protein